MVYEFMTWFSYNIFSLEIAWKMVSTVKAFVAVERQFPLLIGFV